MRGVIFALGVCGVAAPALAQQPGLRGALEGERGDSRPRFARLLDTRPATPHGNGAARRKAREAHHRAQARVLRALADEAPSLSLPEKAELLDALSRYAISGAARDEAIAVTLLSTLGADLTALKEAVDRGGDRHDLLRLVYEDLGDADLRARVLEHVTREARPSGRRRVFSDVDDTLYANYKDGRYPKGTRYPGVLALHRELAGDAHPVFITARPGDGAGWIEGRTHATLAGMGLEAAVLTGSFSSVVTPARMGAKKLENFTRYRALFPEHDAVWFGDSGQADAAFGASARGRDPGLRAALIHDVSGVDPDERARYAAQGVRFFETYVGAAVHAHRLGLIDDAGLQRVAAAAERDQAAIAFDSPEQRAAARALLARDLVAARAARR